MPGGEIFLRNQSLAGNRNRPRDECSAYWIHYSLICEIPATSHRKCYVICTAGRGTIPSQSCARRIISLCDYTQQWPRYFALDGYSVEPVDIKRGIDIFTWEPPPGPVDGVLAAPECTCFSVSGAQYWPAKDADGRTADALRLVDRCLELIRQLNPRWWILENPIGRLGRLRPEMLGKAKMIVHPADYAGYLADPASNAYNKATCLWGKFEMGPKAPVPPVIYVTKDGKRGSYQWAKLGGKSARTKELRSTTPLGLAYATWLGNRLDDPVFEVE